MNTEPIKVGDRVQMRRSNDLGQIPGIVECVEDDLATVLWRSGSVSVAHLSELSRFSEKPVEAAIATSRFSRQAGPVLEECRAIFAERGGQYGDTWEECRWVKVRAAARLLGLPDITVAQCRVLAASALVDVKYIRETGGWKDDSALDGINYEALRLGEIREWLAEQKKAESHG